MERNIIEPQETKEASGKRGWGGVIGASAIAGGLAVLGGMMSSEAADCNPEIDVCVPGVTAAPDRDPVPGNPDSGTEIPVSPTMPIKGEDSTTTSTSTTTTTVAPSTTTTTTTVAPTTTSTTVVATTAPATLPPLTIPIPVNPGHTN